MFIAAEAARVRCLDDGAFAPPPPPLPAELLNLAKKLVKQKPGLSVGGYMGLVMNEFKGKISGKEVMEILKKYTK